MAFPTTSLVITSPRAGRAYHCPVLWPTRIRCILLAEQLTYCSRIRLLLIGSMLEIPLYLPVYFCEHARLTWGGSYQLALVSHFEATFLSHSEQSLRWLSRSIDITTWVSILYSFCVCCASLDGSVFSLILGTQQLRALRENISGMEAAKTIMFKTWLSSWNKMRMNTGSSASNTFEIRLASRSSS